MAEQEDAAWVQALVKALDCGLPRPRAEVDEDVAAKDGVEAAEHAEAIVVEQVHLTKMAELADRLRHVPGAAKPSEERVANLGRRRAKTALPVHAPAGGGDAAS